MREGRRGRERGEIDGGTEMKRERGEKVGGTQREREEGE